MVKVNYYQEQFNAGQLGKLIRARSDRPYYRQGCKTLINFRPSIQGPAIKRKGTVFVSEVETSDEQVKLVEFIFSEIDSYVLEFGNQYVRFFQDVDSVYETAQNITGATQADPVVITYSGADNYANGDEIYISSVSGMTELNGKRYLVANVNTGANTFELTDKDGNDIDGTGYTAYTSGGTIEEVYQITSPYSTSDLSKLKFAQLGDIMYISHPDYRPYKLTRTASTSWTLAVVDNQLGPVLDVNEGATTITLSGTITTGGTSTWTASASLFDSSQVGSVWAIADTSNANIGYARMTSYTSATVADFENQTALFATATASTNWYEAAWSGTQGYPRAVAFHEERLFFAGTDEKPLRVFGSVVSSYENFDKGTSAADDGLQFDISGRVNTIQWLLSDGSFLVGGTYGGLSFIEFELGTDTVTPRARIGTKYGSSNVQGRELGDRLVYSHSNNKSLYEAAYNDTSLKYEALDLNDTNPDILEEGITEFKTIEQPDLAAITVSDGNLTVISRDRVQEILGWYEYQFNGDVESVAVIPTTGDDRVWMVIKRTINGVTRRYIEYIDIADVDRYVDSSIYYSGSATRTLNGLDHLEGETVSVLGDGSYAGDYTVSSGSITLPDSKTAVSTAYIGLSYNADLELMPIVMELQGLGYTQTMSARVNKVNLILSETLTLKMGGTSSTLDVIPFRDTNDAMTQALTKFGNTYPDIYEDISVESDFTTSPTVYIRSDLPFPCTVLGLMCQMEVNAD